MGDTVHQRSATEHCGRQYEHRYELHSGWDEHTGTILPTEAGLAIGRVREMIRAAHVPRALRRGIEIGERRRFRSLALSEFSADP
jgi:hypothetical protein